MVATQCQHMVTVGKIQLQAEGGCNIATSSQPTATQCTRIISAKRAKQGFTHCFAHTKRGGHMQDPKLDGAPTTTKPTLFQRLRAKDKSAKRAIAKGKARLEQYTFNMAKSTTEQRQQWIAHRRYLDGSTTCNGM